MLAALAVLLAAAPLDSDDAAQRLAAVQKWAKKQKKPQLSSKEAKALTGCVELPPVKETGCAVPAELCAVSEGDDGSSGTRTESLSLVLSGGEEVMKPLRAWWSAAYPARVEECDPLEALISSQSEEFRAKEIAAWRKSHAQEYASCVARAQKDAHDDAEEATCEVVLVNACRREAYVTCKSRNLRKGRAPVEPLHRVEL